MRAHRLLKAGLDVAEEERGGLLRGVAELRLEVGEHVELRVERMRRVEVVVVPSAPEERAAARDPLDVCDVDPVVREDAKLLVAEVVADDPDHPDVGEEARSEREVRRRAAEQALARAEGRLDGVERDGADAGEAHPPVATPVASPAAARSVSALSVRSQVKSWSSRPKWPYAAVFA